MPDRLQTLTAALEDRILVLDGAMGTMIHQVPLSIEADYLGRENCPEILNVTRPDVINGIHRAYLEAGADIVETNSFGGTSIALADNKLEDRAYELNLAAAKIARQAADNFSTTAKPRFVAGSMGPTNKDLNITATVTFPKLHDAYYEQAKGLVEGGSDFLLIETCFDTGSLKAALLAVQKLRRDLGLPIPVIASVTIERNGTMLGGQPIDALYASIANNDLLAVGMNCATGPDLMTDHIRSLHEMSRFRVSCYPNAGLPNADGKFGETPDSLAAQLEKFIDHGWLNLVGGCCGTTPAHIQAIAQMASGKRPRAIHAPSHRAYYSNKELVEAEDSNRPLIVGERTNVIGSRLFKNMIAEEKWEEATEIARWQIKNGAHIVDVCLQSSDRDEMKDIRPFYEKLIRKIKAPIMIDTTDPKGIELALTYCQGKSIINSINLEDGEEKFELICPLAKAYGASVICGTIDEDKLQAQAFTRERKLAVAERSVKLLSEKYGIPPEDIIIDPLVFPCATGDENYIGGAVETIEAIRLIKEKIPFVKTILGVSNISFGLPASAREVVNSVFLYYSTKAGLDLAIVNAEKLERFASIPVEERRLAESLLFNTPPAEVPADHPNADDLKTAPEDWRQQSREQKMAINQFHIAAIAEYFRGAGKKEKKKAADLPLGRAPGQLHHRGHQGRSDSRPGSQTRGGRGAAGHHQRPADGRDVRGRPIVQQQRADRRGSAAVRRGDENRRGPSRAVHGEERNLSARQDHPGHREGRRPRHRQEPGRDHPEQQRLHGDQPGNQSSAGRPDQGIPGASSGRHRTLRLVGEERAPDGDHRRRFERSRRQCPAAGGRRRAIGKVHENENRPQLRVPDVLRQGRNDRPAPPERNHGSSDARASPGVAHLRRRRADGRRRSPQPQAPSLDRRSPKVRADLPIPAAPYLDRRVRDVPNLAEVWSYINPFMLYGRHLGFKGNFEKLLAERDPKALKLFHDVEEVKTEAARFMKVKAVWQFFEAERDGNSIHLFAPGAIEPHPHFPVRTAAARGRPVPQRLHSGGRRRPPRSSGDVRRHRGLAGARAIRAGQASRRVLQGARAASSRNRNCRRLRRVAASPYSRRLGFPRSAHA